MALLTGNRAVPVRGTRKQDLVAHLFSMTTWGVLDSLIVDLPPGTGDEVLSSFELFSGKCRLLLVTTPSPNALNVVSRLASLARIERVTSSGVVVNMAYGRVGEKRIYPFGRTDDKLLEKDLHSTIIGQLPLDPQVSSRKVRSILSGRNELSQALKKLVDRLVQ